MTDLPHDLNDDDLPKDHKQRLVLARQFAQWYLGYPDWADMILEAYMQPSTVDFDEMDT